MLAALHIADELHRLKRLHEQADQQLATRSAECAEMLDRVLKSGGAAEPVAPSTPTTSGPPPAAPPPRAGRPQQPHDPLTPTRLLRHRKAYPRSHYCGPNLRRYSAEAMKALTITARTKSPLKWLSFASQDW